MVVKHFFDEVHRPATDFPPADINTLGYMPLSERIQGMLNHGQIAVPPVDETAVFDQHSDNNGSYLEKDEDLVFDETNDIAFDKLDAKEMENSLKQKFTDVEKENSVLSSSRSQKSNEKLSEKNEVLPASEGSGDTSPEGEA